MKIRQYIENLEHPKPKLHLGTTRFDVEGAGIVDGSFDVVNIGEGLLFGKISSASDILTFSCENFKDNKITIDYNLNLEGLFGYHRAEAVITSNGGEVTLMFDITVNAPPLVTLDGIKIATLEAFAQYAKEHTSNARRLFVHQDFMIWLFNTGYAAMDVYEMFASDPNKERGLDNFLVFCGLKQKAHLVAEIYDISHTAIHDEGEITGGFAVRRSTWGYVDEDISTNETEWLKLSKTRLSTDDFDEAGLTEVDYIIFPEKLGAKRATAAINIGNNPGRDIFIRCGTAPPFEAHLDKQDYAFEDKGVLRLLNNTGRDLMIDIYCESFVRFEAKRYFISETAEIKFDIKFSTLKAATLALRKQLYAKTQIHVTAVGGSFVVKMPLTLWN